jgi:hypothetical protein
MPDPTPPADIQVRQFREILVWPVQLMPLRRSSQIQNHWEQLAGPGCPWREVIDEFTADCAEFKERHYVEFVAFLPPVQRFLYGEGTTSASRPGYGTSPIRVFRRHDIARARVTLRPGTDPVELGIAHIDLYFFYDLDVAILVLEVQAAGLSLGQAQELLHRFGRTYPTSWSADG